MPWECLGRGIVGDAVLCLLFFSLLMHCFIFVVHTHYGHTVHVCTVYTFIQFLLWFENTELSYINTYVYRCICTHMSYFLKGFLNKHNLLLPKGLLLLLLWPQWSFIKRHFTATSNVSQSYWRKKNQLNWTSSSWLTGKQNFCSFQETSMVRQYVPCVLYCAVYKLTCIICSHHRLSDSSVGPWNNHMLCVVLGIFCRQKSSAFEVSLCIFPYLSLNFLCFFIVLQAFRVWHRKHNLP